jgi:molybdopterin synthase sulfur carrier subunit
MKVLAFGIIRDIFGSSSIQLDQAEITASELKALLQEKYPKLRELTRFAIAVNNEYATADVVIKPGDEVAIIPPVSGG